MNNNLSRLNLGYVVIISTILLITTIILGGCQLPNYWQWYFENHSSEPVRISGPFDRVFVIPPCYAGYYSYINHIQETYNEATNLSIYIDTQGSTRVPSDTITIRSLANIGMIQVIVGSETNDECQHTIIDKFQVQLQNDRSEAVNILNHGKIMGRVEAKTIATLGPITGVISKEWFTFSKAQTGDNIFSYTLGVSLWKIGDIPTLQYKTP
jgi:hypothetical protein